MRLKKPDGAKTKPNWLNLPPKVRVCNIFIYCLYYIYLFFINLTQVFILNLKGGRKTRLKFNRQAFGGFLLLGVFLIGIFAFSGCIGQCQDIGVIYIKVDGTVDPSTAPISVSGNVYTFTTNIIHKQINVEADNIEVNGNGYMLQGAECYAGINLRGRSNITIKNVIAKNWYHGFSLESSWNNTLAGNTASENTFYGFWLRSSYNNTLAGNTVTANDIGIRLEDGSHNNILSGNTATANDVGIQLEDGSHNNILSGNTATANDDTGFFLNYSAHNTLWGNTATTNDDTGFFLNASDFNTLSDNTATDNNRGIELQDSLNNRIYHNNFIDNVVVQAEDPRSDENDWYHPDLLEGNYWSDYPGVDDGSGTGKHANRGDGIGDTIIPWPGVDFDLYPFLYQISHLGLLDEWLYNYPLIASTIIWETPNGPQSYIEWSLIQKNELHQAFNLALQGGSIPLTDPPPSAVVLADDDFPVTVLAEEHAWPLFLAYVANSLYVEIDNRVSWSIIEYSEECLKLLLDSRSLFLWSNIYNGYHIDFRYLGMVVPAPPDWTFTFLDNNNIIQADRLHTIGQTLEWCRQNMSHYFVVTINRTKNNEYFWQYRGHPPVSRIIEGTPYPDHPEYGIRHWTTGCHGTTGFLRAVLRVINIPVEYTVLETAVAFHATPFFCTEGMYLSHGDDPYNRLASGTPPPYPAEELLIDQATYDSWFDISIPIEIRGKNIGRQVYELALEYLPNYLLYLHCQDIAAGRSHAESEVYNCFDRWYSVAELEQTNLWTLLDDKIASLGGCGNITWP